MDAETPTTVGEESPSPRGPSTIVPPASLTKIATSSTSFTLDTNPRQLAQKARTRTQKGHEAPTGTTCHGGKEKKSDGSEQAKTRNDHRVKCTGKQEHRHQPFIAEPGIRPPQQTIPPPGHQSRLIQQHPRALTKTPSFHAHPETKKNQQVSLLVLRAGVYFPGLDAEPINSTRTF